MKAKTISILLVVTLAALVCLHLDYFSVLNSSAEASLLPEKRGTRSYVESVTVTITVDGITKRLFERKVRECIPWSFEEEGITTGVLFDSVYDSLDWKTKEKYSRDEVDALIDIALDDLVDNEQVKLGHDTQQWIWIMTGKGHGEYERKHKME